MPLIIFADEFETGNALGSHSGQQKLMGVYISLPFLPPHLVSDLKNIFLVTLFNYRYRNLFGNKAVFKKIIDELNILSKNGIQIVIDNKPIIIYFDLILVAGDNLGLNGICGFVENFSAHRFCRFCTATSDE